MVIIRSKILNSFSIKDDVFQFSHTTKIVKMKILPMILRQINVRIVFSVQFCKNRPFSFFIEKLATLDTHGISSAGFTKFFKKSCGVGHEYRSIYLYDLSLWEFGDVSMRVGECLGVSLSLSMSICLSVCLCVSDCLQVMTFWVCLIEFEYFVNVK